MGSEMCIRDSSMFIHDFSGNALEFKAFRNQDQIFSKELSEAPASSRS